MGSDPRTRTVIRLIQGGLARNWSLQELADAVHLSVSRLAHLFRADTGVSPMRHLRCLRLHRAKELTETTFLSIKEVMTEAGFTDASHFVRDFAAAYGSTPRRHRRQHLARLAAPHEPLPVAAGTAGGQPFRPMDDP